MSPRLAVLMTGGGALAFGLVYPVIASGTTQPGPLLVTVTTSPNPYAIAGTTSVAGSIGVYGAGEGSATSIKGVEGISRTGQSVGVEGYAESTSAPGTGVYGYSADGNGVYGLASGTQGASVYGSATGSGGVAMYGSSASGYGVEGSTADNPPPLTFASAGVSGEDLSTSGENFGVAGYGVYQAGVYGTATKGAGVVGTTQSTSASTQLEGVFGSDFQSTTSTNSGVYGYSNLGNGVSGSSASGPGVYGSTGGAGTDSIANPSPAGVLGTYGNLKNATPAPNINIDVGVAGTSVVGSGVIGESTMGNAVVGQNTTNGSSTAKNPYSNTGVFGASNIGTGVYAYSANRNGAAIENNNADFPTLNILADNTSTNPIEVYQTNTSGTPIMKLDSGGNLTLKGDVVDSKGTFARTRNPQSDVLTYAPQEAEPTVEDFGSGQLVNGLASVALAADFRQTIDSGSTYMVFLTPYGENRGLYIASRTANGFVVRETQGGRSTLAFDYRIVARPYGARERRLPHLASMEGVPSRMPIPMSPADYARITAPADPARSEALAIVHARDVARMATLGSRLPRAAQTPKRFSPPFGNRP